ncbi:MAG: TIR domain-containing protein [Caldisericia bacterium]|nr:TIR domain-containing protein [Caldisericia bacterium]
MSYYSFQPQPQKRKVFISFHHKNDQPWFDYFVRKFSDQYEVFLDRSINETKVRSDDPEYINRAIREDYIKGSSITIVLCGAETQKRKYVDWEIYSTLDCEHALLGIALPGAQKTQDGKVIVPDRLYANWAIGYAHWMTWTDDALELKKQIEIAIQKSENKNLIDNSQEKMQSNLS